MTGPGYVTDVGYSATFSPYLAPDWLDLTALIAGFRPPARSGRFAYCELACGRALTSAVLAATHPDAAFHAVDFMPEHIDYARRLAERAGLRNLTLHALDFSAAAQLELPRFQYIVAHGAYSWIDTRAREDLRTFIDRHLTPDGLVFLSYNAMPGWMADLPLQHMIASFARGAPGDSIARFAAADAVLRRLNASGVPALRASPMFNGVMAKRSGRFPASYFAHEYLAPAWQPLYVTDVRADLATIALRPVGSAILTHNFDSFVVRAAQREALDEIEDDNLRELARDAMLMTRLRRDVFGRNCAELSETEQRAEILRRRFALTRPETLVTYSTRTEAGTLRFDNPLARRLVAAFAKGPLPLGQFDGPADEVVQNALTLAAAGILRPVGGVDVPVGDFNAALAVLDSEAVPLPFRALPCGTALALEPALHGYIPGSRRLPKRLRAWRDFLEQATGTTASARTQD